MEAKSKSILSLTLLLSGEQVTHHTLVIKRLGVCDNTGVDTVSLTRLLLGFPSLLLPLSRPLCSSQDSCQSLGVTVESSHIGES